MRDLIDIVGSYALPPAERPFSFLRLIEARGFDNMFTGIRNAMARCPFENVVQELNVKIQEAEKVAIQLKRIDRQTWACRLLRLSMLHDAIRDLSLVSATSEGDRTKEQIFKDASLSLSEFEKLNTKYKTEYARVTGEQFVHLTGFVKSIISVIINHYLAMPYSKIQNYQFDGQDVIGADGTKTGRLPPKSLAGVIDDLEKLAKEFAARTKALLTLKEGDEIVLELPNNFCWVMLSRGYCDDEAKAMGHCGNAGSQGDDRILSLRRPKETIDGITYYEVFLTFILNGNGYLGEMKGRGNDKPAERYHDQIEALLRMPFIKGIRGGGYEPENNFKLADFKDDRRNALLDDTPHLANLSYLLMKKGDTQELRDTVLFQLKNIVDKKVHIDDTGNYVIRTWPDVNDFVDDFADRNDKHTREVASGNFTLDDWSEPHISSLEMVYDKLPIYVQIALAEKAYNLLLENEGEDEADDLDQPRESQVLKVLNDYDDESYHAMRVAYERGNESGAQSEAHDLLMRALNDFKPLFGTIEYTTYSHTDEKTDKVISGIQLDGEIHLILTIKEVCEFLDQETAAIEDGEGYEFFDPDEKIKVDWPYNGYTEFDSEYALDCFLEESDIEAEVAPKPDFVKMSAKELIDWITFMYEKIPHGFMYKYTAEALHGLTEEKLRTTAENVYTKYYG
jgi:hypothetical protein